MTVDDAVAQAEGPAVRGAGLRHAGHPPRAALRLPGGGAGRAQDGGAAAGHRRRAGGAQADGAGDAAAAGQGGGAAGALPQGRSYHPVARIFHLQQGKPRAGTVAVVTGGHQRHPGGGGGGAHRGGDGRHGAARLRRGRGGHPPAAARGARRFRTRTRRWWWRAWRARWRARWAGWWASRWWRCRRRWATARTSSGVSALLAMVNSCASNVATMNIDNGFGGGFYAALISRTQGPAVSHAASPLPGAGGRHRRGHVPGGGDRPGRVAGGPRAGALRACSVPGWKLAVTPRGAPRHQRHAPGRGAGRARGAPAPRATRTSAS